MYQTKQELQRQVRGMEIASTDHPIRKINKLRYAVKSQSSSDTWYDVRKEYGRNLGGRKDGGWGLQLSRL